ncbi:LOW QUALITY PROTEIN: uncharacterized protein FPRO_01079 [Fusarium proliferatum ET1]|uniref:Uncharacterized protein n=1 Tax=Fusarium proliferatum (strain ET1) TaxID=1227346 RepID=A0A1L7V697_FUSPR|nr:LOW QUALITY PROTEIN: uncharacterized protein FPRO_01079 [Fusarium proliferatum ET1]CZR34800.1 uncharacterized protein FPRO_01079 [Fusarium proliferatum ET1]
MQDTLTSYVCLMKHVVMIIQDKARPVACANSDAGNEIHFIWSASSISDYGFAISQVSDMTRVLMTHNLHDRENKWGIKSHNSALALASLTTARR